jgi:tetratricopeptide (TPR) repeat protein
VARANVRWAVGFAKFKAKLPHEAIAELEEGLALWTDSCPSLPDELEIRMKLYNVLGNVYLSLEQFDDCERALNTTIQLSESTCQNPIGRAIALGLSGRSILRRAALLKDQQESRELVQEAERRFRANDELSEKSSSIIGLLLNPASMGDCARLLEEWEELLTCGALLQKRATLYNDKAAKCVGCCMQIEALNALGRDAAALESQLAQLLPQVPKDKMGSVEVAMRRLKRKE